MRSALILAMLSACAGTSSTTTTGGDADAAIADAGAPDAGERMDAGMRVDAGPAYLTTLASDEDFTSLEGMQRDVKFLAQVDGVAPQDPINTPCVFQDTAQFPFHLQFLRSFPGHEAMTNQQYIAMVLRPSTRVWWGGGVQHWRNTVHPISGRNEVVVYTIYAENSGTPGLREADIREVDGRLKGCMPYATEILAFLPSDPYQMTLADQVRASLRAEGIAVLDP